jgi:ketosteroid isomerase-like protein
MTGHPSDPLPDADVDAVEAANQALYAAVEEADLDAMGRLWADGALAESTVCVHPGWPPVVGRARVLRSWALVMAGTPYVQFFLTDVRVDVVGDVGIVTCAENILTEVSAAEGGGLSGGRVVTTNVFRRTPLGWRAWVHHASPVLPVVADQVEDLDDGAPS